MNKLILTILLLVIALVAMLFLKGQSGQNNATTPPSPSPTITTVQQRTTSMKIESSAFAHNQSIPNKYTCDGLNINPPLSFSDVPEGVKSLALIMDDPDAPVGLWVHWTVWNINPATTGIEENSKFKGAVEGMTSFGKPGYGGPCPPDREHRYFFKLYALDTMLNLSTSATKQDLEKTMEGHILDKAELIGLYNRK